MESGEGWKLKHDSPKHLDLFSGIGGFAIAAQWAGFETVAFCESDTRCREFLEKTWGRKVHDDIKTLDGRAYRGISLLTGGPPCQPASRAGKQGGETDDRWLWPEALRVLAEAEPDCVVFENPPGIGDVGLDGILSEMGRLGYEVQVFDIPACAVDSPQLRHRFWIVGFLADAKSRRFRTDGSAPGQCGHSDERDKISDMANASRDSQRGIREAARPDSERTGQPREPDSSSMADTRRERSGQDEPGRGQDRRAVDRRDCADNVADTAEPGREGRDAERAPDGCCPECPESLMADAENMLGRSEQQQGEQGEQGEHWRSRPSGDDESHWANSAWVPCADGKLRRAPDDSFGMVDGLHRSLLSALGNSIVPQEAFEILRVVRELI